MAFMLVCDGKGHDNSFVQIDRISGGSKMPNLRATDLLPISLITSLVSSPFVHFFCMR